MHISLVGKVYHYYSLASSSRGALDPPLRDACLLVAPPAKCLRYVVQPPRRNLPSLHVHRDSLSLTNKHSRYFSTRVSTNCLRARGPAGSLVRSPGLMNDAQDPKKKKGTS